MTIDKRMGLEEQLTCRYARLSVFSNRKDLLTIFFELCDQRKVKPLVLSCKTRVSGSCSCSARHHHEGD
jgi:hypothetical protein